MTEKKISEKQIEQYLVKRVKELGGLAYKFTSPSCAGVPDRIICLPGGITAFCELKSPIGKCTALQGKQIERLMKLKQKVAVCSTYAEVDTFLEILTNKNRKIVIVEGGRNAGHMRSVENDRN